MQSKLYMEFRLYFEPNTNTELLSEMAEELKDKLYNDLVDTTSDGAYPNPTDVTYEITRELLPPDVCACVGLTVMVGDETICSKCGKVQVN
jgi:hypothetical protein